jgi:BCD family chlorophyll transporter-like MFS transporter
MMSDMTIEGATGRYLGLWSMAQAFATSFAFVASGALYSGLVETALLAPSAGFAAIFGVEGLTMLAAVVVLQTISVAAFRGVAKRDLGRAAI